MWLLRIIFLTTAAVFLCYKLYDTIDDARTCASEEIHLIPLEPFNATSSFDSRKLLPADDFSQLIDINKFSFKINTFPCNDTKDGLLLLIMVTSNPHNFENRKLIRSTWGVSSDAVKIVFLIGETLDEDLRQKVLNESNTHLDMIQGSFIDGYRNMTYKHVMGLKWVLYYCPNARYILKADDDIVVSPKGLLNFLIESLSPWGVKDMILCHVQHDARVQRSFRSKWRVSPAEYSSTFYPDYCAGWAIIYSPDVILRLYLEAQKSKYFWIDDAFITGILAERLNIDRTRFRTMELTYGQIKLLKNAMRSKYPVGQYMFGPPNLQLDEMKELYQDMSI